ncbi:helix-turn-helix domain-containing protein [Bradyrhizobium sp. WD16]|uniref:helix-turn-helix domain-containing protein n=1 Tax=Bradyrhizobium sp. WD16 TaxID=1521768 RepID=UPI0020A24BD8|nr:helix-turn-helix domain-containing protein [Bradyrhizobium sp. WD16]UTD26811.1 AraC family transcriptional regulator [Bradyrhizobium sp. WD16]
MKPQRRARRTQIPAFTLYGEAGGGGADALHIESIQSRSRLYHWEIDAHTHQALHQILWVADGPARIRLDELQEECRGPVAVIIPPGVVHTFRFAADTDGAVLTFNPHAVVEGDVPATGEALRDLFAQPAVLHVDAASTAGRRITTLFEDLAEEFAAADSPGSPVPLWLARSVVWRLAQASARHRRRAAGQRTDIFTRFVVLVEAYHRDHWPVTRYAKALGLSPERLNRLVRAETGQAALDLVHARLAREARRRLTYIAAPISRLAFELGFEDPAYFCRFFKRHTGQSPRDYRRATAGTDASDEG